MLYRARYVLTMNSPPLEHAAVRVIDGRITEIGRIEDLICDEKEDVWEGPNHVLMPGLINSHAHLELHHLRGQLQPGLEFANWVQHLRSLTAGFSEADWTGACRLGALESLRYGTTTLVDIGNTGAICAAVADLPFRVFACLEVLGLDPQLAQDRWQQAKSRWESTPNGPFLSKSIVPHSAYSVSLPLLQAIYQEAKRKPFHSCFSIHAGESLEEEQLFRDGTGPLQALCQNIYPNAPKHSMSSTIQFLTRQNLLPPQAFIVHANGHAVDDAPALKNLRPIIVHCPQSHRFFGHPRFEAEAWIEAGIPIALGTDSLASGSTLNIWETMRQFSEKYPSLAAELILKMATVYPGAYLSPADPLGQLQIGGKADLIAVRNQTSSENLFEDLVHETNEVALVVVGGETVLV
jgi:aminodeoxyfutalosine deaminase